MLITKIENFMRINVQKIKLNKIIELLFKKRNLILNNTCTYAIFSN